MAQPWWLATKNKSVSVFLCHSSNDKSAVRELWKRLSADGIDVWFDEARILPGQDWDAEIQKAIRACDIVIVCLSGSSIAKEGYIQKELRRVLDVADEKPDGTIFVLPVKLEPVPVPVRLQKWQWVELFNKDGYQLLYEALRSRDSTLTLSNSGPVSDWLSRSNFRQTPAQAFSDEESQPKHFSSEKQVNDWLMHEAQSESRDDLDQWLEPKCIFGGHVAAMPMFLKRTPPGHLEITSRLRVIQPPNDLSDPSFGTRSLSAAVLVSGSIVGGCNAAIHSIVQRHWAYGRANGYKPRIYGLHDGFRSFAAFHSSYSVLTPERENVDKELVTADIDRRGDLL